MPAYAAPCAHFPSVTCRDNPDVQMRFTYSEALAHQIFAAADLLLVPSLFEPCGLTQVGGRPAALPAACCPAYCRLHRSC